MHTFASFLSWLASILGDEHETVVAMGEFEHTDETTVDEWLDSIEDLATVTSMVDALRTAAQDDGLSTADLGSLADTIDYLDAYVAAEELAAAEEAEARAAILSRIEGGDDEEDDTDEGGEDEDPVEDEIEEPVVVAAARPSARAVRRSARRSAAPIEAAAEPTRPVFTLLKGAGNYHAGQDLPLGDGFEDAFAALLGRNYRSTESQELARLSLPVDPERTLGDDARLNSERIHRVIASHKANMRGLDGTKRIAAMTASGGLCAIRTPLYARPLFGDAGRPMHDFIPFMNAPRLGIQFIPLADFSAGAFDAGITVWTAANDANPTDPTEKACLTMDCDDPITVDAEAIVACLILGNFRLRSDPEQIAETLHYLMMAQAQAAETQLIQSIDAGSVHKTVDGQVSFALDLLDAVALTTTKQRDRLRLGDDEVIDVALPHWVPDAMMSDLRLRMPGDPIDRLGQMRRSVIDYFAAQRVRVGFFRDTQGYGKEGAVGDAPSAVDQWHQSFTYYQWLPGAWLGIEQPDLIVGTGANPLRDSVLNSTNDAQVWGELFQEAAYIGTPDESLAVTVTTCVNGASVGTIDPATLCLSS